MGGGYFSEGQRTWEGGNYGVWDDLGEREDGGRVLLPGTVPGPDTAVKRMKMMGGGYLAGGQRREDLGGFPLPMQCHCRLQDPATRVLSKVEKVIETNIFGN